MSSKLIEYLETIDSHSDRFKIYKIARLNNDDRENFEMNIFSVEGENGGWCFNLVCVENKLLYDLVHNAYVPLNYDTAHDILYIRRELKKQGKKLKWTDFDIETFIYFYCVGHPELYSYFFKKSPTEE